MKAGQIIVHMSQFDLGCLVTAAWDTKWVELATFKTPGILIGFQNKSI